MKRISSINWDADKLTLPLFPLAIFCLAWSAFFGILSTLKVSYTIGAMALWGLMGFFGCVMVFCFISFMDVVFRKEPEDPPKVSKRKSLLH